MTLITRESSKCPTCGGEHTRVRVHWRTIPIYYWLLAVGLVLLLLGLAPLLWRLVVPLGIMALGIGMLIAAEQARHDRRKRGAA